MDAVDELVLEYTLPRARELAEDLDPGRLRPFVTALLFCTNLSLIYINVIVFSSGSGNADALSLDFLGPSLTSSALGIFFGPHLFEAGRGEVKAFDNVIVEYDNIEEDLPVLLDSGDTEKDDDDVEFVYDEESLVEEVERARAEQRFGRYIDSVPALRAGVVLLARKSWARVSEEEAKAAGGSGPEEVPKDPLSFTNPFTSDVILLAAHGGKDPTVGFVMNAKLPDAEANLAREMLRENADADLFAGSDRRELIKAAVQDRDRLWLGAGGPIRNPMHLWTHIHTCRNAGGAKHLADGVFWRGDILEVLLDDECAVKLLYGSVVWSPGQLDVEVANGLWTLHEANAASLLERSTDPQVCRGRAAAQPQLPAELRRELSADGDPDDEGTDGIRSRTQN